MVGVEQWAEIRRMHRVERLSIREISRRTGLHRKTVRRALAAETPPRYSRPPAGSKLDPFKDWICEQLRADPAIQSLRLREMASELGYEGGKTIFDDYVREVRPRFLVRAHVPAHGLSARGAGAVRSVGAARAGARSVTGRPAVAGS